MTASDDPNTSQRQTPSAALFKNRNYRLHWASTALFSVGDYFTLIAMPWLVLGLTKDATALGMVMALESLPRAAFMLVSGGFTDRYTPRNVLLASRALFMLALIGLALDLLYGHANIHQLYGFSFVFGLLAAFAMPAATAFLPQLVDGEQMEQGNGALMGMQQLVQLFAPLLAGLLIWGAPTVATATAGADLSRIAIAFLLSAAAVFAALLMLLRIRQSTLKIGAGKPDVRLADGFRYLWHDRGLRIVTFYMACITFCAIGPLLTVVPQFADQRLSDGALSYGMLYSINGLGALVGFACGGMLPRPGARHLGLIMFTADLIAGLCVFWFGQSTSFATAAPALVLIGLCNSFAIVLCLSWIQRRIPARLSGRVIGLVMFATMGTTPISMTLSGFIEAHYSLTALLSMAGFAISALALSGLVLPGVNRFGIYPSPGVPEVT